MATVRLGSVVADIRGSIGDETYGRNAAGIFVRHRTKPTGEPTDRQLEWQAIWRTVTKAWSAALDDTKRAAWADYANRYPLVNKWGVPRTSNPFLTFIRNNVPYYKVYDHIYANGIAPAFGPLVTTTTSIEAYDGQPDELHLHMDLKPDTDLRDGYCVVAFAGKCVNRSRNFYNGPWRFAGTNHWEWPQGWQDDPMVCEAPYPIEVGKRVFVRYMTIAEYEGNRSAFWQTPVPVWS